MTGAPANTSPATTSGRACTHWIGPEARHCGATPARRYVNSIACADHTPARLAGHPEPPEGTCAPKRCLCGTCPSWTPHNPYNTLAGSWTTDARAIASGKRRASPELQAAAKATVAEQREREQRLRKGKPWRLLATGSRRHTGKGFIWRVLDGYLAEHPDLVVVHGACYPQKRSDGSRADISADWLVHLWCQARGVPDEPHPADWQAHGDAAGPIRNQHMVDLGANECAAFPQPGSRGTHDCIRRAKTAGIPVERWEA